MSLIDALRARARGRGRRIVLPEGGMDERIVQAARLARDRGVAQPVLLGHPQAVQAHARRLDIPLDDLEIIDPDHSPLRKRLAEAYRQRRLPKESLSPFQAHQALADPLLFGAMLVQEGLADGMTAGVAHATREVLRAALRCIGTRPGIATVSGFFIMVLTDPAIGDEGILVFADCAVVPVPDARQLADIAVSSAMSANHLLGMQPRVALLSFSTRGSAEDESIDRVRQALDLARARAPQHAFDGELQVDAAIDQAVGHRKSPGSLVAGRANVLIFPDLNAGNIGYKLVERLCGARAIGPILQGMAKPVNDLSRGAEVEDIAEVITITAVQSCAPATPGEADLDAYSSSGTGDGAHGLLVPGARGTA